VFKINKHDIYVEDLFSMMKGRYDNIYKHLVLANKKRRIGEIDLVGVKDNHIDVFEVKCSHRIVKAKRQLKKLKKVFDTENISLYFYCGASKELKLVESSL